MYTYHHSPGYSGCDHLAAECIARAGGPFKTRKQALVALADAWRAVRNVTSGASDRPKIDVVRLNQPAAQ